MGRKRIYANGAERQKAHRQRAAGEAAPAPPAGLAKKKNLTRPMRLNAAVAAVRRLQEEYQQWLDSLLDFQEGSELEERLTETVEFMDQALELLSEIQLPKGFGRD